MKYKANQYSKGELVTVTFSHDDLNDQVLTYAPGSQGAYTECHCNVCGYNMDANSDVVEIYSKNQTHTTHYYHPLCAGQPDKFNNSGHPLK